jgi:hypothetical protein
MIQRERRTQKLCSASRRSTMRFGTRCTRSSFAARNQSSTGRSVSAQRTETSGMTRPPMPKPRMKGSGMKSMSASPMPTAVPLKTTAQPAVCIVRTIASSFDLPFRSSSR